MLSVRVKHISEWLNAVELDDYIKKTMGFEIETSVITLHEILKTRVMI